MENDEKGINLYNYKYVQEAEEDTQQPHPKGGIGKAAAPNSIQNTYYIASY